MGTAFRSRLITISTGPMTCLAALRPRDCFGLVRRLVECSIERIPFSRRRSRRVDGFQAGYTGVTKRPCAASPTERAASVHGVGRRAQPSKENSDHGDGCPRCIEGMENFTPGLGFGEVGLSDLDRPRQPTSGPHVHNCSTEDCGRWGGYGFASAARVETRWWCWEHYPHKTPTIVGR